VDPDPVVRARAAASLQILGDGTKLDRLEEIYRDGDAAVQIAVAESYGRIGGSAVQPLLVRIVGEVGPEKAPVRAAALQAMAASRHADAVRILAFYMLNDADQGVQQAAERALTELGDEEARRALLDLLATETLAPERKARVLRALSAFEGQGVREALGRHLEDPDARVVDQAALGLAAQREAAAVPYLIAILRRPEEALRPKAVEALQDLTSVTLLVASYEAAADQYEAWFRQHRTGNDRSWFRDAVAKKGYDTTALAGYVRGEQDLGSVPVLLRTIRDDDPVLRRNSDLALRRVTGHAPPRRLDRTASREEADRIADRWVSWAGRNVTGRGR
jgi:HEAT repeat protein